MTNLTEYKKKVSNWKIMEVKMERARIINAANNDLTKKDRDMIKILDDRIKEINKERKGPRTFGRR